MSTNTSQLVAAFLSHLGITPPVGDDMCVSLDIPDAGTLYIDSLTDEVGLSLVNSIPEYQADDFMSKAMESLHSSMTWGVSQSMQVGLRNENQWVVWQKVSMAEASVDRLMSVCNELRNFILQVKGAI